MASIWARLVGSVPPTRMEPTIWHHTVELRCAARPRAPARPPALTNICCTSLFSFLFVGRSVQQFDVQSAYGHVFGESGKLSKARRSPRETDRLTLSRDACRTRHIQAPDGEPKDTVRNVERTGEFCWSVNLSFRATIGPWLVQFLYVPFFVSREFFAGRFTSQVFGHVGLAIRLQQERRMGFLRR